MTERESGPGGGGKRKWPGWRLRRRRLATGTHVLVSILLASVVVGMANYICYRRGETRWDISTYKYYQLSDKTLKLLGSIQGRVRIITLLRPGTAVFDEVQRLLSEYQFQAAGIQGLDFEVAFLDPARDLAAIRDIVREFAVVNEEVVVFSFEGRHKIVSVDDLEAFDRMVVPDAAAEAGLSVSRKKTAFRGELVFSSAIHSLTQEAVPVVYLLSGHGERDPEDFGSPSGFGRVATAMRRDNIDVRRLILAAAGAVPADAGALILAAPTVPFSASERDILTKYMEQGGRLLVLTDPRRDTGIEPLLSAWGVALDKDIVVGLTLTGRELYVRDYGRHPIVKPMEGILTVFFGARSVEPAWTDADSEVTDRPRVEVLAMTTVKSWADRAIEGTTLRFDSDVDRRGPISVAVAVERGPAKGLAATLRPTRMVVFGDSDFVSNGILESGAAGNLDMFLNTMNWLLEREALLAIAPQPARLIQPAMNEDQVRKAYLVIVVLMPMVAVMFGVWVWERRRRS